MQRWRGVFSLRRGVVAGMERISSCPLHCRRVRQAASADNVKAIYSHAAPEESSAHQCCKGLFLPSMFTVQRGQHMSRILIYMQQRGRLRRDETLLHTYARAQSATSIFGCSFMWLGRAMPIHISPGQFSALLTDNIWLAPVWGFLLSPINRGRDQELNFLWLLTWGHINQNVFVFHGEDLDRSGEM